MEKKCKNMNNSRCRKATISKIFKIIGTKSLICFTMTAIMLIGTIFVSENDVYATSKTQDEAINWLYSVEGHPFDVDGAYGVQCADLAMAYYEYLGEARPYGNGCDYFTNALPPGWERYANTPDFIPKPGDVVSWDSSWGGGAGHVAIVLSATVNSLTVMEQNGTNHTPTHQKTYNSYSHVQGFNRPNFTENDTEDPIINRVWMEPHDHTALMLKVTASDSNGISEVRSYHKRKGLSDWHMNYMLHQANDEWWVMLGPDDGYGDYDLHIYARDNAGNETLYGTDTGFGVTAPTINNYDVIDLDETGFTVTGEFDSGETSLESFQIPVWTSNKGQDDVRWETPDAVNGNRFYKRINFSDHNNERGLYNIHMYATNKAILGSSEGINGYSPVYKSEKTLEKDGHIYALYDNALSWENAKKKAEEFGGHLATINSEEEQAIVNELLASGNKKGYWLGGYKDNQWKWITGENFSYNNWAPNQPDNAHNQEDKLMAFKNDDFEIGSWNDAWNEDYVGMGFVIEYENLNDKATKSVVYNGKKYIRYDRGLPWNEAQKFCESQGGNLAMAKDAEIQRVLNELTQDGRQFYFLGLTNLQDNKWKWLDNSDMDHSNWDDQEPTNTGNIEHYVAMVGKTGKWRDVALNISDMTQMGFICEVPYEANVEQVTLDKSELILNVGDTSNLSAVVKPDSASNKKLKWDSSNTRIATVDQNGKVTAIAAGQAKITATSVNGKQGSCTVTVNEPEATDQLRVVGSCDKTVRPGDTVTIMVSLENYDISEDEIATLQIEVPNETNELSYIADSKKLLLEGSEFAANDNIIFAYLPFSEGANTISKDKKDLFSFQMKASDKITDDMDAQLPITITMGNQDDLPIMQDALQNITVPIRKSAIVKGDLNGSGGVDIMDARKAKRAAMKEIALTDYELQAGDLDGDGKVTIIEARKIKRAAMKEIEL